ncbi:hypothetical protein Trydic_g11020 [Trypoxylus dichotomus]
MLIAFAVGLLIIFLLEIAVGIAAACYNSDFQDGLKSALRKSVEQYDTANADKETWDNVQQKFKCCGVDGPNNWQGKQIPTSCCREKLDSAETESAYCKKLQTNNDYLSTIGCYEEIKNEIQSNAKCLIGVGIGIAFIEIVGVVLACWLAKTIKSGEK